MFTGELQLDSPIQGTSSFQRNFESLGPFDAQRRSLRQFDLKSRLFKFPCSYMVHSKTFGGLPREVREYVLTQIKHKLSELAGPVSKPGGYSNKEIAVAKALIAQLL